MYGTKSLIKDNCDLLDLTQLNIMAQNTREELFSPVTQYCIMNWIVILFSSLFFGVFWQDILQNEELFQFTSDFKIGLASDVAKVSPSLLELACILVPTSGSTFKRQRTLSLFNIQILKISYKLKYFSKEYRCVFFFLFLLLSFCALLQISALLGYGIPTSQSPGVPWPPY